MNKPLAGNACAAICAERRSRKRGREAKRERITVENKIAKTLECALREHSHELSQITWHSTMGLLLGIRLETIEEDFKHIPSQTSP